MEALPKVCSLEIKTGPIRCGGTAVDPTPLRGSEESASAGRQAGFCLMLASLEATILPCHQIESHYYFLFMEKRNREALSGSM